VVVLASQSIWPMPLNTERQMLFLQLESFILEPARLVMSKNSLQVVGFRCVRQGDMYKSPTLRQNQSLFGRKATVVYREVL
jgi:hypothetical protein